MSTNTEELLSKFVRTGLIVRHIDGGAPKGHAHGAEGHGHDHGPAGHDHGPAGHDHGPEGHGGHEFAAQAEGAPGCHGHGPEGHGHGPESHGHGPEGCGHGQGHGRKKHGARCHGQARVLSMVALKEGINQKDLAFLLGIRPQTLGEMLQKLEERGLVERRKSEADGRAVEVTLTDAGRDRAQAIEEHRKLAAADIFAVLSDEEKEQLGAILDKLGAELDKYRPKHTR